MQKVPVGSEDKLSDGSLKLELEHRKLEERQDSKLLLNQREQKVNQVTEISAEHHEVTATATAESDHYYENNEYNDYNEYGDYNEYYQANEANEYNEYNELNELKTQLESLYHSFSIHLNRSEISAQLNPLFRSENRY